MLDVRDPPPLLEHRPGQDAACCQRGADDGTGEAGQRTEDGDPGELDRGARHEHPAAHELHRPPRSQQPERDGGDQHRQRLPQPEDDGRSRPEAAELGQRDLVAPGLCGVGDDLVEHQPGEQRELGGDQCGGHLQQGALVVGRVEHLQHVGAQARRVPGGELVQGRADLRPQPVLVGEADAAGVDRVVQRQRNLGEGAQAQERGPVHEDRVDRVRLVPGVLVGVEVRVREPVAGAGVDRPVDPDHLEPQPFLRAAERTRCDVHVQAVDRDRRSQLPAVPPGEGAGTGHRLPGGHRAPPAHDDDVGAEAVPPDDVRLLRTGAADDGGPDRGRQRRDAGRVGEQLARLRGRGDAAGRGAVLGGVDHVAVDQPGLGDRGRGQPVPQGRLARGPCVDGAERGGGDGDRGHREQRQRGSPPPPQPAECESEPRQR